MVDSFLVASPVHSASLSPLCRMFTTAPHTLSLCSSNASPIRHSNYNTNGRYMSYSNYKDGTHRNYNTNRRYMSYSNYKDGTHRNYNIKDASENWKKNPEKLRAKQRP